MDKRFYKVYALAVALVLLATSACGGAGAAKGPIHVGAEDYTEEFILGNMYQMLLADAGFDATYQSIGGTAENHKALLAGQIDLYPEYTGTALIATLGMNYHSAMTRDDVYNTVKQAYLDQFNVVWLEPTRFNNTYCLAMKQDEADQMGVKTLSDLSAKAGDLILATTQEFTEREDGLPGLQKAYGGFNFKEVRAMDPGLKYTGLNEGDVDVTTCFGTDGQIAAYNLVVLDDDKRFWPPYPVAPIVRKEVLDKYPEIADTLNKVAPLLDGPTMAGLNWEVDGNHKEPDEVAREFLKAHNLIK
jgi:osmoprotectant transport system substrate-binding protein